MRAAPYAELRPLLLGIAYRMLGSVADAEEVVQDACLRHHRAVASGTVVADDRAYLATAVTRLAIDRLRSARAHRETYVGPWLPEPLLTDPGAGPDALVERSEALSLATLALLERLTPLERAVFVLHDVFDLPYDEVAAIVQRSEAACRQLAARARGHVDAGRQGAARYRATREQHEALTERLLAACATGDLDGLVALLAEDAAAYTDGGGRARAASKPVVGREAVARYLLLITRPERAPAGLTIEAVDVNGHPGRVLRDGDGAVIGVLVIEGAGEAVQRVDLVVNPDKLHHLQPRER